MPERAPDWFRLHEWEVEVLANELIHVETEDIKHVEPKVMAVLACLAAKAGTPVTREALMATVWPEVVVSEDALNRAVSKLRRALGDDPAAPRFIETIPTVGYRLVAPVEPIVEVTPTSKSNVWKLAIGLSLALALVQLAVAQLGGGSEATPTMRPLTRAAGAEIHPALAPDGQRVAYAALPRGGDSYDLAVQSLDADASLRLTDDPASDVHPVWHRDADGLWFLRCAEPLVCTVWEVAATGGTPRRLTEAPVGRWGLAAADGALVALVRDSLTEPYRLAAIDPATGMPQRLTDPPAGTLGDLYPTASPDGRTVAFVRHDAQGEEDLFLLDLEVGMPRRLTTDGRGIRGHAWTPDGSAIVYVANRDGAEALWRVAIDGSPPTRLPVAVAGRWRSPTLAAGRLVLAAQQIEVDLLAWDAETGWQPRVASTAEDTGPSLSSEGRLAFVSTRSGAPEVYVAEDAQVAEGLPGADDTAPRRLTEFGGPLVGAVRWSPDGQRLAFEAQVEQQASVYVLEAEGGVPRALTDAAGYDVGPRWSTNGRFVYVASNRPDPTTVETLEAWALWRVPVDGGTPERLGPLGSYVGEALPASPVLPDGALVYMRQAEPGLWLRPSRTTPEEQVLADLARQDWGNWSVVSAATDPAIVYPRRTDDGVEIRRLRLADRADTLLTTLDALPGRIQALAVSPDGQRLVAAQTVRAESDLVLVEPIE
ncbi:MAG: winged helix-turn-helix domain-containing protein [Bacteroidota bacterium]